MNRLALFIFIVAFTSCDTGRRLLSSAEEDLSRELSDECACEVVLQPDEYALQNSSSNGTFTVTFINSSVYYCNGDSAELARISANIARRLAVVMSNKKNYSHVRFRFIQTGKEAITCTRSITVRRP